MEKPIDVINFTRLLMGDQDDLVESEIRKRMNPRFIRTIAPTPRRYGRTHPNECINQAIESVREIIQEIEKRFGDSNVVLIGRSYGGFMALMTAVRMQFENIIKVVGIEAPFHPDIDITTPDKLVQLCKIHYENRPDLAKEAMEYLLKNGSSPLVMIQGLLPDGFVPSKAQVFPGKFNRLTLPLAKPLRTDDVDNGHIFTVPESMGQPGKVKSFFLWLISLVLNKSQNTHLFWNEEKASAIFDAIDIVTDEMAHNFMQRPHRISA